MKIKWIEMGRTPKDGFVHVMNLPHGCVIETVTLILDTSILSNHERNLASSSVFVPDVNYDEESNEMVPSQEE